MSVILSSFERCMTRKIFRIPSNIIERTSSQIQVNNKKIRNVLAMTCNFSTESSKNQLKTPVLGNISSTLSRTIETPTFPDASKMGAVTWVKNKDEQLDLYDIIMKIETDKSFIYISAPANGTIAEKLVPDGASVRPGQKLFRFAPTTTDKDVTDIIAPPTLRVDKIIAVPVFSDASEKGIIKWVKEINQPVDAFEIILRIETDKTCIYMPAPAAGIIVDTLVKDGDEIHPGQNIFKFEMEDKVTRNFAVVEAPQDSTKPTKKSPIVAQKPRKAPERSHLNPGEQPKSLGEKKSIRSEYRLNINRFGDKIVKRLKQEKNLHAMLTTHNEIDMGNIILWRKQNLKAFQDKYGTKFGFMSVFCKACAYALRELPCFNAVVDDNEIIYRDYVDISVALPSPKGLVVPVIRNVEQMHCADIAKKISNIRQDVEFGNLDFKQVKSDTFTIVNGGTFGSLMGIPIIKPRQSSVLGMHGIFHRPVAHNGDIKIRPVMYVALTYNQRLIENREAVHFLQKVKNSVEEPCYIGSLAGL